MEWLILRDEFRMLVHASAFFVPVLAEATSTALVLICLAAMICLYLVSETLRTRGRQLPLITHFTLMMSRADEATRFIARPAYLAVGIILSLLLFPKTIAYASIAIVAVGDPVASYVGRRWGRTHAGRKTIEGFAAGLAASFVAASLWVYPSLALVGSATGMLLELLGILDDNLTIPIGAGSMMILAGIL